MNIWHRALVKKSKDNQSWHLLSSALSSERIHSFRSLQVNKHHKSCYALDKGPFQNPKKYKMFPRF